MFNSDDDKKITHFKLIFIALAFSIFAVSILLEIAMPVALILSVITSVVLSGSYTLYFYKKYGEQL